MPYAIGARGARIWYSAEHPADARGADAVVLIQGLGLSSRFWFDLPRRLAEDARHPHTVIALDNRGAGRSDGPRGPLSTRQMADDVAAVLDDAGIARAFVVGISLGGMIAQEVALRHEDRVRGLVLLATTPGLPHGLPPGPLALARLVALGVPRRRSPGSGLGAILLPRSAQGRAKELLAHWPAALREEPQAPRHFFAQLAAAVGHSTGARLAGIRCPTVVVAGDEDVLMPPRNARVLARKIPRAELEVLRDCGHGIPLTDDRVVHRALARLRAMEPRG